jgi:hypothetical protein
MAVPFILPTPLFRRETMHVTLYREDAPFFHSTKNLDFYNLFTLSHGDLYLKTLLLCLLSDLYPFTHKSSSGKHKYSRKLLVTLWPFSRAGTFSGLHVHILS